MTRKLTCIECPQGCVLSVNVENGKVAGITGSKCAKGEKYAVREIENPVRILTSTVLSEGLSLKMVPVRTDHPIPKGSILKAMKEIKKMRIDQPLCAGDVIVENFAGSGVNLIATRDCF